MPTRDRVFWVVVLAGMVFGALLVSTREPPLPEVEPLLLPEEPVWPVEIPDFAAIAETAARKQAFFDFLRPVAEYHNQRLLALRQRVLKWQRLLTQDVELSAAERKLMRQQAEYFLIDIEDRTDLEVVEILLRRVDVVPVSLVLAQAATESGWGSSRFAVAGNNLFGIWCYKPGCGIVPLRRGGSATHEVAAFPSPADSVSAYFRNINTHPAYREFRDLRQELRAADQPLSGLQLAEGLSRYSKRGQLYIEQIKGMIRGNQLERLDV